jgi:ribosomal protein S18 acetylase RimI-like enzyme
LTFAIRRAGDADLEALRRLWEASVAETTFTPYPGAPFEESLVADHLALVAEGDGAVIGTVYLNLSSPHFGYLFGLYVVPAARRRGVGHSLMLEAAAHLRDHGRTHVVLSVDTPNEHARRFYERLGFEDASRLLRAGVDDLFRSSGPGS